MLTIPLNLTLTETTRVALSATLFPDDRPGTALGAEIPDLQLGLIFLL